MIVTIVILAILIGVTIGGITSYVHKARVNTDIANAQAIERALQTLLTRSDLSGKEFINTNPFEIDYVWDSKIDSIPDYFGISIDRKGKQGGVLIRKAMRELFPDGLLPIHSGGCFVIVIKWDKFGNLVSLSCKAYKDLTGRDAYGNPTLPQIPLEPIE